MKLCFKVASVAIDRLLLNLSVFEFLWRKLGQLGIVLPFWRYKALSDCHLEPDCGDSLCE